MKKLLSLLLLVVFGLAVYADAKYVNGYTRKNGTYVQGYEKADKSSDSYSYEYKAPTPYPTYKPYKMPTYETYKEPKAYATPKPYKTPTPYTYTNTEPKQVTEKGKKSKKYCATCERDKNGKIKRSEKAKKEFMKQSGYVDGRNGWEVDHIKPLSEGGADDPSNMQWLTEEDHKKKTEEEYK